MSSRTIRLAVVGGDGIGPEVTAEALKVLRAAAKDVTFDQTDYDLGARRWHKSGETLPDAGTTRSCSARAATPACPAGCWSAGCCSGCASSSTST